MEHLQGSLTKTLTSPIEAVYSGFLASSPSSVISNSASAGTPGTPVDIKSVPKVRQLSCKKLIYSYTFGSNCIGCNDNNCHSAQSSPNIFDRSRSPTTNCRQNYQISSPNLLKHRRYTHHHQNLKLSNTAKRKP